MYVYLFIVLIPYHPIKPPMTHAKDTNQMSMNLGSALSKKWLKLIKKLLFTCTLTLACTANAEINLAFLFWPIVYR